METIGRYYQTRNDCACPTTANADILSRKKYRVVDDCACPRPRNSVIFPRRISTRNNPDCACPVTGTAEIFDETERNQTAICKAMVPALLAVRNLQGVQVAIFTSF